MNRKFGDWIPITGKEDLPDLQRDVIVNVDINGDSVVNVDCLIEEDGKRKWSYYNGAEEKVTAWMPLPKEYRAGGG